VAATGYTKVAKRKMAPYPRLVGYVGMEGLSATTTFGNHHLGVGGPREVEVLKGANMSYRRSAVHEIGFDERLRGTGAQVHFEVAMGLAVKRYPAQRFGDDQRDKPTLKSLQNAVHNETYALLKWLPWWRKPLAFVYGLTVGTRLAPGLMLVAERWLREPGRAAVGRRFKASMRGRLDGFKTFRLSGGRAGS
jgi:hypothetical protein